MAKQNKPSAAPAMVEQPANQEKDVMEIIRSGNMGEKATIEEVEKRIKDENNERLIAQMKSKVNEARYINLKARLMLHQRRAEEAATKQYLTATKEALDKLTGVDKDGKYVNPTLTIAEYEDERTAITKKKREAFAEAEKIFRKELNELRNQYPGYYCYEWDN